MPTKSFSMSRLVRHLDACGTMGDLPALFSRFQFKKPSSTSSSRSTWRLCGTREVPLHTWKSVEANWRSRKNGIETGFQANVSVLLSFHHDNLAFFVYCEVSYLFNRHGLHSKISIVCASQNRDSTLEVDFPICWVYFLLPSVLYMANLMKYNL